MQIKKIIEMGILIEPVLAKELNQMPEQQFNTLVTKLVELDAKPMILDEQLVNILTAVPLKIIKQVQPRKEISMPELATAWNTRFSILQKALMRRPELNKAVSIRSANRMCTLIGAVNIGIKTTLEDPTGSIQVMLPEGVKVFSDDVVGVVGNVSSGVMKVEEVFFPDIPLQQAKHAELTIGIETQADFILQIKSGETTWADCKGISVMLSKLDEETKVKFGSGESLANEIIKRRTFGQAPFDAIEPIPDVLFIEGADNFTVNHKGTTIVGFKKSVCVNMRDRSVESE